jgi:hypothetical protein
MPATPNLSPNYRRPRSPQKNFPQNPPPHPLFRSMKTTKGLARCTLRPEIHHHSVTTQNMADNKERRTALQLQEEHGNAPTTKQKRSRGHGTNAQTVAEGPVSAHQQAAKSRKQKHESHPAPLQLQDNRSQVHPHGTGQQAQPKQWTVTAWAKTMIATVLHRM